MKTRLYLDTRNRDASRPCPLYLCISRHQRSAFYPLNVSVLPARWDAHARRMRQLPLREWPERPTVARIIDAKVSALELELMKGEAAGELHGMDVIAVRDWLLQRMSPDEPERRSLVQYIGHLAAGKRTDATRSVWFALQHAVERFRPDTAVADVDAAFLRAFFQHLQNSGLQHNSVVARMRTLRAVMNAARDDKLVTGYPFARFPLRIQETRKRSLSVEALRRFIAEPPSFGRDYFVLSFLLLGMNPVDIFNARVDDYDGKRIRYRRSKTGKLYDVRVFPECAEIIERHRGRDGWLFDAHDGRTLPTFRACVDYAIKNVAPEWKDLSMYWARHTWATIAANDCDVSQDVISHALGHSTGAAVTAIYVNFDLRKVDAANRSVIDWVMYGKK